jgi:pantoate--beta-alanine ligase
MEVIKTIAEMKKLRRELSVPVGFVPTMGYLHEGHLSLVRQAKEENRSVVVSIFVNPTQFGPREDFKHYPRDTKRDLAMLQPVTDAVFMPSSEEMYPAGFDSWVEIGSITQRLEGTSRPTHFRGVATIVAKLFNIVQPTKAYFGQKDAQQVAVIKKMAAELNMNLEVIALPTVRESDGLAMSSRNTYLSPEQRQAATVLYKSLTLAQELWTRGERNAGVIRQEMAYLIQKEPLANIDYISIADNETLEELHKIKNPALVSLAVKFGKTRLIDNIVLG